MRLRFNPMPGLTVVVLICLPILISLGVWQFHRWQWKTDLLAEIDAAVSADPLPSLQAMAALPEGSSLEFRRIQLEGEAIGPVWHVYKPSGSIQWQPVRLVRSGEMEQLVAFPTFDDQQKSQIAAPVIVGPKAGYIRRIRPRRGLEAWLGAENNPEVNRWFEINPEGAWKPDETIYIELDPVETDASDLPIRRPDLPNNHVSYMLTWWSFAIILLIIYGILHHRAGRLSWG